MKFKYLWTVIGVDRIFEGRVRLLRYMRLLVLVLEDVPLFGLEIYIFIFYAAGSWGALDWIIFIWSTLGIPIHCHQCCGTPQAVDLWCQKGGGRGGTRWDDRKRGSRRQSGGGCDRCHGGSSAAAFVSTVAAAATQLQENV